MYGAVLEERMSSRYEVFSIITYLCDHSSLICHWNVYVRSYCNILIEFCDSPKTEEVSGSLLCEKTENDFW